MNRLLDEKIQSGAKSLLDFSLPAPDSNKSLYEFQGEDYRDRHGGADPTLKWIAPPKRERRVNYAVDAYYREVLRQSGPAKKAVNPRPPKQLVLKDFQFYPARLHELYQKETDAFNARLKWRKENPNASELKEIEKSSEFGDLTEAENIEKEELRLVGFGNWTRRDYQQFCKACELYGRTDIPQIANHIESKTEDEVRAYSKAFFENYQSIDGWERIISNIEKGEQRREAVKAHETALRRKVTSYKDPLKEMKISYGPSKGKQYTAEHDAFLVYMAHVLGYGHWEELRIEIRNSWLFRFDWFFKSRSAQELGRRCDTLIRLIEKEFASSPDDPAAQKKRGPPLKAAAPSRGKSPSAKRKRS